MNPKRNRQRGKETERAIALLLGGKRIGTMCGEDVEHPLWSIECKSRQRFYPLKWLEQASKHCPPNKTPLVVIHQRHKEYMDSVVMISMRDWIDLHGGEK